MRILDRYIGFSILLNTLGAMLVLLTLIGFLNLVDELKDVGEGSYGTSDAIVYVLMNLPGNVFELFPVSAMLGSLIGLGSMANYSELTAMRAAGISLLRIIGSVLKVGVALMVLVFLVGEVVAPYAEHKAKIMKAEKQLETISLKTRYGFWARDGRAFINIRNILPPNRLEDITINEFNEQGQLQLSTQAASARYSKKRQSWILKNIRQTEFKDGRAYTRTLEQAKWSSLLDPKILNVVVVESRYLPFWELYKYINFLVENGQSAAVYEVSFWNKLLAPFVTLVMLLLSVPFVFGSLRSVSIGQRIFTGVMIGVTFHLLNRLFSYTALVYEINPLVAVAMPGLFFLLVAMLMLKRVG